MAVATVLASVTENSITLLQTDDGGGGANIIDNASLIAALVGEGINAGGLWDVLHTDHNPNSPAIQRALLMGDGSGWPADHDMRNVDHCVVELSGVTVDGFIVDADVDAGTAARGELNVSDPGAGYCLLTIKFVHSIVR